MSNLALFQIQASQIRNEVLDAVAGARVSYGAARSRWDPGCQGMKRRGLLRWISPSWKKLLGALLRRANPVSILNAGRLPTNPQAMPTDYDQRACTRKWPGGGSYATNQWN